MKYYLVCVAGLNLKGESEINTCGFWAPEYPTRKRIFDEAKEQCDIMPVDLIMSITAMTRKDFDRFMIV